MQPYKIVFFDGECNLCNKAVQFIIKRDPKEKFRFVALQSNYAKNVLKAHKIACETPDTIVVLDGNKLYLRSAAVLYVLRHLTWYGKLLSVFLLVPRPLRDAVYQWCAKNRYRWFGKRESCMLETPALKRRFIEENEG